MTAPTTTLRDHADVWTDHAGLVHERQPDMPAETLCGINAGTSNHAMSARACPECIAAHLAAEPIETASPGGKPSWPGPRPALGEVST